MADMTSAIFLGSEVIIISVKDVRRLVRPLVRNEATLIEMKELGILDILMYLQGAVTRYDQEMLDHHRYEVKDD